MSIFDTGISGAQQSHTQSTTGSGDPRFFKPSLKDEKLKHLPGEQRSYGAKVRILPFFVFDNGQMVIDQNTKKGVTKHYAFKKTTHKFRENNKFHQIPCTKTVGVWDCPVCSDNVAKNRTKLAHLVDKGKNRSNSESWVVKIEIIDDSINPKLNGEIMLWEVTGVVYAMIQKTMGLDRDGNKVENVKAANQFMAQATAPAEIFDPLSAVNGVNFIVILSPDPENLKRTSYKLSNWERDVNGQLVKTAMAYDKDGNISEEGIMQKLAQAYLLSDYTEFLTIPSNEELMKQIHALDAASPSFAPSQASQVTEAINVNQQMNQFQPQGQPQIDHQLHPESLPQYDQMNQPNLAPIQQAPIQEAPVQQAPPVDQSQMFGQEPVNPEPDLPF